MKPGDVFVVPLPNGQYGAVRILRTDGKSSIVSTTRYIGPHLPALDDPLLFETLMQKRFAFDGWPARQWLDGEPPMGFQFVGCFPLTEAEAELQCLAHGGKWSSSNGAEAFLEWRWLNDRAALEAEVQNEREVFERRPKPPQKPKKMMDVAAFWAIIELLDWKHLEDDDKVMASAVEALAAQSKAEIRRFAERLAHLLYLLDTREHAGHIGELSYDEKSRYISADGFLYARCAALAGGKAFYESALNDPTRMPKDVEFESLLGLAATAYESKTGEEFEYEPGCCFETFSNVGGWKDE